jgi:hypothetical protein
VLWEALRLDADEKKMKAGELLDNIESNAEAFVNSGEVQGRQSLMQTLSTSLSKHNGKFMLLLGGKDVGKSLILSKLEQQLNAGGKHMVVTVSGRKDGADLNLALFNALVIYTCKNNLDVSKLPGKVADLVKRASTSPELQKVLPADVTAVMNALEEVGSVIADLLTPAEQAGLTLGKLLDTYASMSKHLWHGSRTPVIFVDEVNEMLQDSPPERAVETRKVLVRLTRDTKERKAISVVLAGSEHSEPYRLAKLGFKPEHFTRAFFVSEVEPASMYELLVGKWGMGPHFATACMAVYGGHIWRTINALDGLAGMKADFPAYEGYVPASGANVMRSMRAGGKPARALLKQLAQHGYARCDPEGAVVELLSQNNVAAVVQMGNFHTSAPHAEVIGPYLVPASEHMRLVIANFLALMAESAGGPQ